MAHVVDQKAVEKLKRILALAHGSTFAGEASTAAKMADDFTRKHRLHQHLPHQARIWIVSTDTGNLVWRFQPFSDAEILAVPGSRRWVGQAAWSQHITFALSTGVLMVLPVTMFAHTHDAVGQVLRLGHEKVIGSFFSATPITVVTMTANGVASLLHLTQSPRQNNHWFARLADGDEVVSAKVLPPNAENLCLVTDHGVALTIPVWHLGSTSRRTIRLNPGDVVRDFKLVSDLNTPIRLNTPSERFEIIPARYERALGSEGVRINPPTEDAKVWWFRAWDTSKAQGKAPSFSVGLRRQFETAGYKPLTREEKEEILHSYEDWTLSQAVKAARIMVGAFRDDSIQACSDAAWWLFLLGTEPTEAEQGLLSLTTHDPALFCAVVVLCDVCQTLSPEAIELLWTTLTAKKLPHKLAARVVKRLRG